MLSDIDNYNIWSLSISDSIFLYSISFDKFRNMLSDIDNYNIWSFYIAAVKKNISDKVDTIFYDSLVDDFENKF